VPAAFADVELRASETDALGIVVRRARISEPDRGCIHRFFDRIVGFCKLDRERSAAAAHRRFAALPRFKALEVRQHFVPRPTRRTAARPAFEVAAGTARQCHHVDRRRAAQHFAAQRHQFATCHAFFGDGIVAPIEHAVLVQFGNADRHAQVGVRIITAGFEQQHARRGVFGQPAREHAAGRAGADDDVIVLV
jgi:hypothetical protein